ncbi:MAG: zinc carboxypeptidase [Promethearchaeota archaeon]|nr:MAG: zinc carboxypeptidase [Candidatus Lokiarchaeota archaeon]
MELYEILDQIPEYEEFMTVAELDHSSIKLAKEFKNVKLIEIGKSGEGRTIYCLKIGGGKENALLFGFPHPNEPIGSMSLEFLSRFLAENPEFTKKTGYTWYLIKAIDIDGAKLNEGWFKGEFDPIKYARHFYRCSQSDQVEWSFPIKYKKLKWDKVLPETQALMHLINEIKPKFMFSLHNWDFCGVYFYVTREVGNLFVDLTEFVKKEGLPLHLGEPELQFRKTLHDAIFRNCGIQETYDFIETKGVENPQEFIKCGNSSWDYLKTTTNDESFTLVCELPYFTHNSIGDNSLSKFERRDVLLQLLEYNKNNYKHAKRIFNKIKKYCDKTTRLYRAIDDYIKITRPNIDTSLYEIKTSSMYDGKATIAQAFDSNVSRRYIRSLLMISMIARLSKEAISNNPDNETELLKIKNSLEQWIEQKINELLSGIEYEVIPIQKLVRVQIGSAFITLKNLSEK